MPRRPTQLSDLDSNIDEDVEMVNASDDEKQRPRRISALRKSYAFDESEDELDEQSEVEPSGGTSAGKRYVMVAVEIRNPRPQPLATVNNNSIPSGRAVHHAPQPKAKSSEKRRQPPIVISDSEEDDEDEFIPDEESAEEEDEDEDEDLPVEIDESDDDEDIEEEEESEDEDMPISTSKPKAEGKEKASGPKHKSQSMPCGLKIRPRDGDLPPISNLKLIFDDMVSRIPDIKGLFGSTGYRKLRVATMCSGTESPLLALGMISRSVKSLGWGTLDIEHVFSCEIEPYKQAYIERNFKPPILFRDIKELGNDEATTAYGSKEKVPGGVDILIAGTSCVDFSNLNNKRKTLGEKGESTDTFIGMMDWVEKHRPLIVIQENIKSAKWTQMRQYYLDRGYSAEFSINMDTKKYYIPHTRQRGYLFAFDQKRSTIPNKWMDAVKKLERPATSTFESFMLPDDDPRVHRSRLELATESSTTKVVEWERCEVRHHRERLRLGLGTKKPLTLWEEGGVCTMLDFMWQDWGKKQVHRVLDLMDINMLLSAKAGFDPTYKAGFWNLSQNVDRNTMGNTNGICPCLTPTMVPYLTYRGGPMVGFETLHMQGLPIDELLLTRESSGQLQNLAGNAMSSTVVGAAMIAALVLGKDDLSPAGGDAMSVDKEAPEISARITGDSQLIKRNLDLSTTEASDMKHLLAHAKRSSRMCICEGRSGMTSYQLQVCRQCGFSSCKECGRRPTHDYIDYDGTADRLLPLAFEEEIKGVLPMILVLSNINDRSLKGLGKTHPDVFKSVSQDDWTHWSDLLLGATKGEFRFKHMLRKQIWSAIYDSPYARLELILDDAQPEWRIFAKCPDNEGLRSRKRALCKFPVARMLLRPNSKDVLTGKWELCVPVITEFSVSIRGSGDKVDCWEKKLGLTETKYQRSVWSRLTIKVPETEKHKLDKDISGEYKLLDECDAACGSLHKKIDSDQPVYFFLEQERISVGKESKDSFIFSTSHHRLALGEEHPLIARLHPSWRQDADTTKETVTCIVHGRWLAVDGAALAPPISKNDGMLALPPSTGLRFSATNEDCGSATAVMVVRVPLRGQTEAAWSPGIWTEVDQVHQRTIFESVSWLTERIRSIDQLSKWRPLALPENLCNCERCAPSPPKLKWFLIKNKYKALESPEEAAPFERALKNRPKPIVAHLKLDENGVGNLRIGLNVPTLVHRALAALPTSGRCAKPTLSWRLITDYIPELHLSLPEFTLTSNRDDPQHSQPPNFRPGVTLRPEQLRSLTWMLAQEHEDARPFVEEEVSEALLPELNWRLEGRAEQRNFVKGGVLADQVGYGKTAITIGLIDCLQSQVSPEKEMKGYIPVKATLIVVPGQLCEQWPSEIRKFTGTRYKTLVLKNFSALKNYSIQDIMGADIIIVTASLFKSNAYKANIAGFAATRDAPAQEGRRFLDWQATALAALRDQIDILRSEGARTVRRRIEEAAAQAEKERKQAIELFLQTKRKVGAAYVAAEEEKEKVGDKRKRSTSVSSDDDSSSDPSDTEGSSRSKRPRLSKKGNKKKTEPKAHMPRATGDPWSLKTKIVQDDWKKTKCLPLDAFYFNRVVVDEFTYYKGQIHAAITSAKGASRWVLSGTPPINDFADVKTIAVMLHLHLGIDDDSVGTSTNRKKLAKDRTEVEKFTAFRDVRSPHWHTRRHQVAQHFMNQFMRQNIAEISEIAYEEHVIPIVLPPAERAIYLELDHYLRALEYQMRRAKSKMDNDRDRRLQESLAGSATADEALIKRCSHFNLDLTKKDEDNAVRACDLIVRERKSQLGSCREDIRRKLRDAVKLHKEIPANAHNPRDLFTEFVKTCREHGIGDYDANIDIKALLDEALARGAPPPVIYADGTRANPKISEPALPIEKKKELKTKANGKLTKKQEKEENSKAVAEFWPEEMDEKLERIKAWTTALRTLCRKELAPRHRSLRYFTLVRDLQRFALAQSARNDGITGFACSGTCGRDQIPASELAVLSSCGHHGCYDCINAAAWNEKCLAKECEATARPDAIVMGSTLGIEDPEEGKGRQHGKKLETMVHLIKKVIPKDEKVLLFVQFQDLMAKVVQIFKEKGITYDTLEGDSNKKSKKLKRFQNETMADKDASKVLLLNVMDESAAGANLTCANHAILLSPLLAQSDYEYNSCETQAIGRVRRYGQERKVHVWRFLSTETKDVEIFEQRSRKTREEWRSMVYSL